MHYLVLLALLALVPWCRAEEPAVELQAEPVEQAEDDFIAQFRTQLASAYTNVPADDPLRLRVIAMLEAIPTKPKDANSHRQWQVSVLQQTMQEANQVAQILSGPVPLPTLGRGFALLFAVYAERQMAMAELLGNHPDDNQRLGEVMQGAQAIMQRWQRVNQIIYQLADASDDLKESAEALAKMPESERAATRQALSAADASINERITALGTAMEGKDELLLIQALAAANLTLVEWQRAYVRVVKHAEVAEQMREAGLTDDPKAKERMADVLAAFDRTTASQVEVAKVRAHIALLEYKAEGLDDRANRLEEAESQAMQALEMLFNGQDGPSEADQNADRIPLDPKF